MDDLIEWAERVQAAYDRAQAALAAERELAERQAAEGSAYRRGPHRPDSMLSGEAQLALAAMQMARCRGAGLVGGRLGKVKILL